MKGWKGLVVSCSYPESDHALDAPENDARFYEHLLTTFGFTVRRLSDYKLGLQSSHRGNILRSVEWLVQDAQPGDNVAFVFAGHGICTTCTTGDRRDELDRAFLAAELEDPFPANLLFDTELQSIFALLPAGVLLTCIIDAPCGDTVVRLPWFYDGKTGSFCGPSVARHSSLWQGDRHPRRERGGPNLNFTIRGAPSSLAKSGTAKQSKSLGPSELFPGVAAFLICACRQDQVCLEAPLPGGPCYGLLTSSFATVIQQALLYTKGRPGSQNGDEAKRPWCSVSYLELARMLEDDLQKRLSKVLTGHRLEQHVMLGFSQDPSMSSFLRPQAQVRQIPRPLRPPGDGHRLPASVLANLVAGSGGEPRWPNVLVQLCRVDKDELPEVQVPGRNPPACGQLGHPLAKALLSAEVLGEFWLPPLAHIFPEAVLPGDPPVPSPATPRKAMPPGSLAARGAFRRGRGKCVPSKTCHIARKELWCRLRAPSVGSQQQYCTWGAALGGQFPQPVVETGSSQEAAGSGTFGQCGNDPAKGTQAPKRPSCLPLTKLLRGGRHPKSVYDDAARKLRWRGGMLTALEFEYFAVREIGLDLDSARKAFGACLEVQAKSQGQAAAPPILLHTGLVESSLLAEALEDCDEESDPGFVLEARLELEWRSVIGLSASAAAGELRLFAAELRPRQLPQDTLLAALNARETELGYNCAAPSPMAKVNRMHNSNAPKKRPWPHGLYPVEEARIMGEEDNSMFFLRFGLCASRDVYPDVAEVTPRGMLATPRLNAPEASWIVPHIVFVSPALRYARLPPTGTWCVHMPQSDDSAESVVPICTCARLCDAQKAAFAVPERPGRPAADDDADTDAPPPALRKAVAPIPLKTNGYGRFWRSSSDSTLTCAADACHGDY